MPGGETNKVPHDRNQVSLCTDEIGYWCDKFHCKERMLKAAVSRIRSSAAVDVEREIQRVYALVTRASGAADLAHIAIAAIEGDDNAVRLLEQRFNVVPITKTQAPERDSGRSWER